MDMRLKSQPYSVVSTIMYRPNASVKRYEFPLAATGLKLEAESHGVTAATLSVRGLFP